MEKGRSNENGISRISEKIKKFITPTADLGNLFGFQKKDTQREEVNRSLNTDLNGVIALKASQENGLLVVVYSNGIMRIWSVYSGKCIRE